MGQAQGFQMRCHAPGLVNRFSPSEVVHLPLAYGLRQKNTVGLLAFILIDALKHHGGSGCHGLSLVVVDGVLTIRTK
jgi:hypothetical protein